MPTPSKAERARARAARRTRKKALSLPAIVDVALRIVDAEGTEAVSMRRVAAEFDTGPASLYAYVRDKDDLLRHVLDRVVAEVSVPTGDDWQEVLRRYGHDTRAVLVRHNDAARLTFGVVPGGDTMLAIGEKLLGVMTASGVPRQVAAWGLDVLALYVAADVYEGWLSKRIFDDGSGRPPEVVGQEYYERLGEQFARLDPTRYPALTASTRELMNGSSDERFAFGLDMLIAGFAAQIAGPAEHM